MSVTKHTYTGGLPSTERRACSLHFISCTQKFHTDQERSVGIISGNYLKSSTKLRISTQQWRSQARARDQASPECRLAVKHTGQQSAGELCNIFVVSVVIICKQCLQTVSALGGDVLQTPTRSSPMDPTGNFCLPGPYATAPSFPNENSQHRH